jgi:hypothetical protein
LPAVKGEKLYSHLQQAGVASPYGSKLVAINLRRELRATFPNVKFSVTQDGSDSVLIHWTDGPTVNAAKAISGKYLDDMEDVYRHERSPWTTVSGSAQHIFQERKHSVAARTESLNTVGKMYS